MTEIDAARMAARLRLVEQHVGFENRHDLDGIMGTFGAGARYDDEPFGAHYRGRDEVRRFYQGLLQALPGLQIGPGGSPSWVYVLYGLSLSSRWMRRMRPSNFAHAADFSTGIVQP